MSTPTAAITLSEFYVFYDFQLLFQPVGAIDFIGFGGIKARAADKVGAIPDFHCRQGVRG